MKLMDMTSATTRGISRSGPHSKMPKTHMGQGPRLGTVQMVSAVIKEAKEYPSRYQLWRNLPKGMGYKRLEEVLDYLESTNQIMIDKDGTIIWILADNPKLKKLLEESTQLR